LDFESGETFIMRMNSVEIIMGAVIIAVAVLFVMFAYDKADLKTVEGYAVSAKFDRIDGIRRGSDVRMSGIKIGTVTDQLLDPKTYLAVVTLNIDSDAKLPLDTSAAITSDGLLGNKYMALSPGGDDNMIPRWRRDRNYPGFDRSVLAGRPDDLQPDREQGRYSG